MFRNAVFTINNYTVQDITLLCELYEAKGNYLVAGFEMGESKTPHIQGYIELTNRMRLNTLKKNLPRAHIENRKGKAEEASNYCKKEGNFCEFGKMKEQGKRTDLDNVRTLALEGGMREVSSVCSAQQIRVAEKFLTYNEEGRNWKPTVIWIWGETGTGKSKTAREICGEDVYCKNTGSKWWDGYDRHEDVIIDDFRDSWWEITYMLGLLDRYEFQVEVKGGMRQFVPKQIVITSAQNPANCYRGTGEAIKQLLRRIDIIEQSVPEV